MSEQQQGWRGRDRVDIRRRAIDQRGYQLVKVEADKLVQEVVEAFLPDGTSAWLAAEAACVRLGFKVVTDEQGKVYEVDARGAGRPSAMKLDNARKGDRLEIRPATRKREGYQLLKIEKGVPMPHEVIEDFVQGRMEAWLMARANCRRFGYELLRDEEGQVYSVDRQGGVRPLDGAGA